MIDRSRYAQVALAYLRWWPLRLFVLGAVVAAVALFLTSSSSRMEHKTSQLIVFASVLWMTAGGAGLVAAHVKSQLADPRARLAPGYRTPHLVIAAIVLLLLTFGFAALMASQLDVSMLGTMALASLAAASTAWWIQLANFTMGMLVNVLWLSLLNRRVVFAVGEVIYGRSDVLAWIMLATGAAALVALWARLRRLHEEMPEYARRLVPPAAARATMAAGGGGAPAGADWFESLIRRPVEARCIAAAGAWTRARHLRATGLGRLPWLMAACLAASMLIIQILGAGRAGAGALESFMALTMILPPALVFSHWSRRWPALGYESLRPTSRQRFVREVGLAIALDLAETWALFALAGLIPLIAASPANVTLAFSSFLWLSAAMAVAVFGMNAWLLRLRTTPWTLVALALSGMAPIIPVLLNRPIADAGLHLPLALGLLLLGVLVTLDAYARWCRTDLE